MEVKKFSISITENQEKLSRFHSKIMSDESIKRYKNRAPGLDEPKIRSDIFEGKKAEFAVYNYYSSLSICVTHPVIDTHNFNKSFDPDLYLLLPEGNKGIHVKQCKPSRSYPFSWLFQSNDKLLITPKSEDLLVLCIQNKPNKFYAYIVSPEDCVSLYKDTINYMPDKKALYLDDILDGVKI